VCFLLLMPEFILGLVYITAAASGVLLAASGLYGHVPVAIASVCSDGALLCRAPYIGFLIPLAFSYLYRLAVAYERSRGSRVSGWRLKLRRIFA
jgi:hypothetical protein